MSVILRNNSNSSDGIGGGGGNGYISCAVNILNIVGSNGQVKIYWNDPEDTSLDNIVFVKWSGTIVVRKEGSPPENENDGTVVLDNKNRNAYSTTPFIDTDVTGGSTYYYGLFPYTEDGTFNYELSNITKVTVVTIHPTFSENTWESVIMAINSNSIPDTWNIGDTINLPINGYIYHAQIWDFNKIEYTDGGIAPIVFGLKEITGSVQMCNYSNLQYTNSTIHKSYLPSVINTMPQILQDNIKSIRMSYFDQSMMKSVEFDTKLCIPNEAEMAFYISDENFQIFSDNNSRRTQTVDGIWFRYWTRTASAGRGYAIVASDGSEDYTQATDQSPCVRYFFCL